MDIKKFITKRSVMTAVVILAGILLIALIFLLSGRGRKDVSYTGGEDSPYPYSWTEYKDGSIVIRPFSFVPEGCSWSANGSDDAVIKVAQTGDKKAQAFTVSPAGEGDSFLTLDLTEQGGLSLASVNMVVESSGSGKKAVLTVTGHRIDVAEDVLRGEEHGVSYLIMTDGSGDLHLSVSGEGEDDWGCFIRSAGTIEYTSVSQADGAASFLFYPSGSGDAAFTVYSYSRGVSLDVTGRADSDGIVTARGCSVNKHDDWAGKDEAQALAGLFAREIGVPAEAEDVEYSLSNYGSAGPAGTVFFSYLGVLWKVSALETARFSEIINFDVYDTASGVRSFLTEAGALYAYFDGPSEVTAWCDAEDCSYLIEGSAQDAGSEIDYTALIETANIVMSEND